MEHLGPQPSSLDASSIFSDSQAGKQQHCQTDHGHLAELFCFWGLCFHFTLFQMLGIVQDRKPEVRLDLE